MLEILGNPVRSLMKRVRNGTMEPLIMGLGCLLFCVIERLVTGNLLMAPVTGLAVGMYVLKRMQLDMAEQQQRMFWAAEARAAQLFSLHMPRVRESTVGFTAFLATLWPHYFAAKFKTRMLTLIQTAISEKVPEKYALEVREVRLGSGTPVVREMSACTGEDGALEALDITVFFESQDLVISLAGRTPIGNALIKLHSIRLQGTLRLIPVPTENLIAWSFATAPALDIGFEASVGGVSITHFNFLKRLIEDALKQQVTEPRRKVFALSIADALPAVKFKSANVHVAVHGVHGTGPLAPHDQVVLHLQMRKVQQSSAPLDVLPSAACQSQSHVHLPAAPALHDFAFKMDESSVPLIFKLSSLAGQELGQAVVHLKYLKDGSIAMWAIGADGGVLARRWQSSNEPWQVDLPLELFQWADGALSASKYTSRLSTAPEQLLLREPLGAKPVPSVKLAHVPKRKLIKAKLQSIRTSFKPSKSALALQPAGASGSAGCGLSGSGLSHFGSNSVSAPLNGLEEDSASEALSVAFSEPLVEEGPGDSPKGPRGARPPAKASMSDLCKSLFVRPASFPGRELSGALDASGALSPRARSPAGHSPSPSFSPAPVAGRPSPGLQALRARRRTAGGASREAFPDLHPTASTGSNDFEPRTPLAQHGGASAGPAPRSFYWQESKSSSKKQKSLLPATRSQQASIKASIWCDQLVVFRENMGPVPEKTSGDRAIIINIVTANDLSPDANGTRDPYVKIGYGNRRLQTSVLYQTRDPQWHETWVLPENTYVVNNLVYFEVHDKSTRGSVLIGRCKLSLDGLAEREIHTQRLPLSGANSGSLSVELAVCPGDSDSALVKQTLSQLSKNRLRPDQFKVVVERARNLVAADFHFRGSSSDPYIVVEHGEQSFCTPTIYRCLHPEWNSHFEFRLEHGQLLRLRCFDSDKLNADEFLGSVSIEMERLQHDFQGWIKLAGVRSGEVFVRIFQSKSCLSQPDSPSRLLDRVTIVRRSDPEFPVMTSRGPLPPNHESADVNRLLLSPDSPPPPRAAAAAAPVSLPSAMTQLEDMADCGSELGAGEGGEYGPARPWLLVEEPGARTRGRGRPSRLASLLRLRSGRRKLVIKSGASTAPARLGLLSWSRLFRKNGTAARDDASAAGTSDGYNEDA